MLWKRAFGIALAGLLVGLVLAGPAAAQGQRTVAQIEGQLLGVPAQLPATYEAALEIRTQNSGGVCACTQTWIHLKVLDEGLADAVVVSPSEYSIDWVRQTFEGHPGEHVQDARLTFHVPRSVMGDGLFRLEIGGVGGTDNPSTSVEVLATQIAVPLPAYDMSDDRDTGDQDEAHENDSSSEEGVEEPGTDAPTSDKLSTQAEEASSEGVSVAPEIGAGLVAASLAGVGLVHRRWVG